jgi:hypothetical protein
MRLAELAAIVGEKIIEKLPEILNSAASASDDLKRHCLAQITQLKTFLV